MGKFCCKMFIQMEIWKPFRLEILSSSFNIPTLKTRDCHVAFSHSPLQPNWLSLPLEVIFEDPLLRAVYYIMGTASRQLLPQLLLQYLSNTGWWPGQLSPLSPKPPLDTDIFKGPGCALFHLVLSVLGTKPDTQQAKEIFAKSMNK